MMTGIMPFIKYRTCLSDFKRTWYFSKDFRKIIKY